MHIQLAKYNIFLGKWRCLHKPCTPRQGALPLEPRDRLAQALGLLATLAVAWAPAMLKIFLSLWDFQLFSHLKVLAMISYI